MSGYTKFGYTEVKDSDFNGKTLEELQAHFHYLPKAVVLLMSNKYSPKVVRKSKKKTED